MPCHLNTNTHRGTSKGSILPMINIVLLGVSFDTSLKDLIGQIPVALKVFAQGVEAFVSDKHQASQVILSITNGSEYFSQDSPRSMHDILTYRPIKT